MMDGRTQMLAATVHKLYKRGAFKNIQRILLKTHTADIAAILESFPRYERQEVFKLLTDKQFRAEVISYVDSHTQKELLLDLDPSEVGQTVSLMETDDAADLLSHLPEQVSNEILSKMDKEDSAEVADLMGYPDDSAGGMMKSEFLALKEELTVADAIREIQHKDEEGLVTFYLYVVNDTGHLVGVISLKQLLMSRPSEVLRNIMSRDVLSVTVETPQEEVARVVERYDFLCMPVVNAGNELLGVITVDDVIDVIREEGEENLLAMGGISSSAEAHELRDQIRARWPWLSLVFLSGIVCFGIVFLFARSLNQNFVDNTAWLIAGIIPLILSIGTTAGHQSTTVAVGFANSNKLVVKDIIDYFLKELRLAVIFALVFGLIAALLATLLLGNAQIGLIILVSLILQLIISVTLGALVPLWLRRLSVDLTVVSVFMVTVMVNISSLLVLFAVALTIGKSIFG